MSASRVLASRAVRVAALAFACVASFPGGFQSIHTNLDPSWNLTINLLGVHGFSSKVVFTYGPLGFLLQPMPVGQHVLIAAVLRVALQLAFVCVIAAAARNASAVQTVLFAALYALAVSARLTLDAHLLILGVTGAALCLRHQSKAGLLLLALSSGWLLFAKTSLAFAAASILIAVALLWVHQQRTLRTPLAMLALHLAAIGAAGLFFFASPAEFAGWLKASLQIASEYSVSMSFIDGSHVGWGIALTAVWMLAALALHFSRSAAAPVALLSAGLIFLFFKQGFVREDLHVLAFHSTLLACASLLLLFARGARDCLQVSALCLILLAGVAAVAQRSQALPAGWMSAAFTLHPGVGHLRESLHPARTHSEQLAASDMSADVLPARMVERLRGGTVGVVPWELNFCAANGLRCSWNPTLQTYVAYTRALDQLTADHFTGPDAPDFVLIDRVSEFDGRSTVLDAPLAWQALLANYELAEEPSNGPLLLSKKPPEAAGKPPRLLGEALGHTGEWLEIPASSDLVLASLDLKLNLRGQLAKLFLRVPSVWLDVEYESGRSRRIRLVPATAAGGLLAGGLPGSLAEVAELFKGVRFDAVRRVRLSGAAMKYLRSEFAVRWSTMQRPAAKTFPRPRLQPAPGQPRFAIEDLNGSPFVPDRPLTLTSRGVLELSGWARAPTGDALPCGAMLNVDGVRDLPLLYGLERRWTSGVDFQALHDGFEGAIAASTLGPGSHQLKLRVVSSDCTAYSEAAGTIALTVR